MQAIRSIWSRLFDLPNPQIECQTSISSLIWFAYFTFVVNVLFDKLWVDSDGLRICKNAPNLDCFASTFYSHCRWFLQTQQQIVSVHVALVLPLGRTREGHSKVDYEASASKSWLTLATIVRHCRIESSDERSWENRKVDHLNFEFKNQTHSLKQIWPGKGRRPIFVSSTCRTFECDLRYLNFKCGWSVWKRVIKWKCDNCEDN